jgi:hypothetical protein
MSTEEKPFFICRIVGFPTTPIPRNQLGFEPSKRSICDSTPLNKMSKSLLLDQGTSEYGYALSGSYKKSCDFKAGFEPATSRLIVWCSNQMK